MAKAKFKAGDRVRIKCDRANHGIETGTIVTITRKQGQYYYIEEYGVNIMPGDAEKVEYTMKEMQKELKAAKAVVADLNLKIKFMKANKLDEFDETQYRVYAALQALKSKGTDIEKAKLIAELMK
jgi:hypothetical protein